MAYSTNIDVGQGIPKGGVLITEGTTLKEVMLDIRDAIIGDSESRWSEVTASSPTPSHLQQFASTVNASNSSDGSTGFNQHVTLYLDDDPGLNRSSPGARLMRFYQTGVGIQVAVLDTARITNSRIESNKWIFCHSNPFSVNNEQNDSSWRAEGQFISNYNDSSSIRNDVDEGNNLDQDLKFFYVLNDEYIWMNTYHIERTDNFASNGAYIYHPSEPTNGSVKRDHEPFIWYFRGGSVYSPNRTLYRPASDTFGRETGGIFEPFMIAGAQDYQDRHIFTEMWAKKSRNNDPSWFFDKFVPDARMVGKNAFPDADAAHNFPTTTLDGTKYFVAGGHDSGFRFLLKLA